jgi:hypothetical protein
MAYTLTTSLSHFTLSMRTHFETVELPNAAACSLLRTLAGLSLAEMATIVHLSNRQSWWRFEAGLRQCDLSMWELALLKTDQHPFQKLVPRQ